MNFLGIGPGELILILILLLVVVGPERLPQMSRQAGRWLVRARNWLQTSPDAAVVLRARQEIEQELALLKSSLIEVQSVRDEVLDVAKQFNESVSPLTEARTSLSNLLNEPLITTQAGAANGQNIELPPVIDEPSSAAEDSPTASTTPADVQTSGTTPLISHSEVEELSLRLQAVMADLWALQEQLKQRGALDNAWQPPSFTMQLPADPAAPYENATTPDAPTEEAT